MQPKKYVGTPPAIKNYLAKRFLDTPSSMTMRGPEQRKPMKVGVSKPPKMRFQIGTIVRYQSELYEIMYAYRTQEDPHEWFYCLEERKNLKEKLDEIGGFLRALGCGASTPRIVYQTFRDHGDANTFFWDIPLNGGRTTLPNKKMMQSVEVVSSGMLVSP